MSEDLQNEQAQEGEKMEEPIEEASEAQVSEQEPSINETMAQAYAQEGEESQEGGETQEALKEEIPDISMAQQQAQERYQSDQSHYQKAEESKLSVLLDIPLEVTVEIGSTQIPIEDVLKLNPNSVIELDRYIHEPVDLKVNGRVIAKGELYTVKNNFGIRITHIITPEDRLKILEG